MAVAKKNVTKTEKPAAKAVAVKTAAKLDPAAPVKRGRGRPPTGEALTPAERKKLQRERDRDRAVTDQSVDGLLQSAGISIAAGNVAELMQLNSEMVRRAKLNQKKNK